MRLRLYRFVASLAGLLVLGSARADDQDEKRPAEAARAEIERLGNLEREARASAEDHLVELGAAAVPTIKWSLGEDRRATVRAHCARALGRIGAPDAVPALVKALKAKANAAAEVEVPKTEVVEEDPAEGRRRVVETWTTRKVADVVAEAIEAIGRASEAGARAVREAAEDEPDGPAKAALEAIASKLPPPPSAPPPPPSSGK